MREYVEQIYNEGLGLTLYKPVENKLKKIKNNKLKKILINVYKFLYLLLAIIISIALFLVTYPL